MNQSPKKLLIDIGHPAHVHLFKNFASILDEKGWQVLFTVRRKDNTTALLEANKLTFVTYGTSARNLFLKVVTFSGKVRELHRIFLQFRPDITISHSSFYLSQVSWFHKIPNITLEDTGNMEQIALYLPFIQVILTPESYHRKHGSKQIYYNGYHETAYIHADYFNTGINNRPKEKKVILIRLVDWSASHDVGHKGFSSSILQDLINLDGKEYEVKILSEKPLPKDLLQFKLQIEPHLLHDYLQQVRMYVGEGATLASECALLGIPSVYVNSRSAGVIKAKQDAGLIYHFKSEEGVIRKVKEILDQSDIFEVHRRKASEFLRDRINLTKFLVWFIEDYPHSVSIMKKNPDYQYNFR